MSEGHVPYVTPRPPWLDEAQAKASDEERQIWLALEEVEDPEYPVSVVDMGLIYSVKMEERVAAIDITFTSLGCPCMEYIIQDVRERVLKEPHVDDVTLSIVWDPPWTRQRLSEKGKEKLMSWGISV